MNVNIEHSWKAVLQDEFEKPYFKQLVSFLKHEKSIGKKIYPEGKNIFNAFQQTPFDKVRVLLLGQDPYHGAGQAHGLCFSVQKGIKPPPSLINIFKELQNDLQIPIPSSGDLSHWAAQGILLLNASLTVEEGKPLSHANIGWQIFTDAVIKAVSDKKDKVIFILWGKFAQQKEALIQTQKHVILKAAHPSPLSAYHGFFGCKHFSKINELLEEKINF
ncbi:MAG TPA: uracil-DNA glycosylase [Chitinophagaceae bacterium]|nr:MAG: uracil-DNA glycosylase [Bacteroidetes bacterium OLB11]HMN32908.1 uracil-DNA glycosylase [Chitinophagaceae bacterium]